MNEELNIVAVISAGWSPKEDDPLIKYTEDKPKALIPIAGKPMIAHVVDALTCHNFASRKPVSLVHGHSFYRDIYYELFYKNRRREYFCYCMVSFNMALLFSNGNSPFSL